LGELIVYSPQNNNRLRYVLDFIFNEQCGLKYILTDDRSKIKDAKIVNYSAENIEGALTINYSLYLNQLVDQPDFEQELFFDNNGLSNFDVFAAIFFLLARVEEYETTERDKHDRYQAKSSILYKKNLLHEPIIDQWVEELKRQLISTLSLEPRSSEYTFVSTIDVDHIYAYKHKAPGVKAGSFLKDLLKLNFNRLKDRGSNDKDPYDRIEDMLSWHKDQDIEPIFFILTAQRSTYDKSLSPSSFPFIEKISSLANVAKLGIHPSYASNTSKHILKKEINDLAAIVDKPIIISRQHFLKLSFPDTYRNLIERGIKEDYTLGYAEAMGFRAGTSRPFYWFDLERDEKTDLKLVPFQIMDGTMKNYLSMTPAQALKEVTEIIVRIKAAKGCCSIIWHNSSFYEAEGWGGWEHVYKKILEKAADSIPLS